MFNSLGLFGYGSLRNDRGSDGGCMYRGRLVRGWHAGLEVAQMTDPALAGGAERGGATGLTAGPASAEMCACSPGCSILTIKATRC